MKVLVTGSDGYIGVGVVKALLASGHTVIGCGLKSNDVKHQRYSELIGNVFAFESGELRRMSLDVVIHLAWRNGFRHGDPCHIDELPMHYSFIRSCIEGGVPRLAVMGTMHEVGYHEGAVRADTPCNPTTPYAIAKNALRQLAMALACDNSATNLLWMRGFYIVSSDGRGDSIFAKIVHAVHDGQKTFPFTSGKNQYDFLDYDDFCSMVAASACDPKQLGIVNICSGHPESLGSRVERFLRDGAFDIELEYGAFPDRPYDSPSIWGYCETGDSLQEQGR